MDSGCCKDPPRVLNRSPGSFESQKLGEDTVQEAVGQATVSEKITSIVSICTKVQGMDGQNEKRVVETSMAPSSLQA